MERFPRTYLINLFSKTARDALNNKVNKFIHPLTKRLFGQNIVSFSLQLKLTQNIESRAIELPTEIQGATTSSTEIRVLNFLNAENPFGQTVDNAIEASRKTRFRNHRKNQLSY